MEDNISTGLFGLNRRDVENYIADLKKDYEEELRRQNEESKRKEIELDNQLFEKENEIKRIKRNKFLTQIISVVITLVLNIKSCNPLLSSLVNTKKIIIASTRLIIVLIILSAC